MTEGAGFFLSPQQKHIWSAASSARSQVAVLIEGALDEARLRAALLEVVKANESLRTVFQRQTGMKLPFQVVRDTAEPSWSSAPLGENISDLVAAATERMRTEALESIAVEESPLRSTLFTGAGLRALWVLTAHAAAADAQSMQLIVAQTAAAYAGTPGGDAEPLRYVQFAQWQNDLLEEEDDAAKDAAKFWAAQSVDEFSVADVAGQGGTAAPRLEITVRGDAARVAAGLGGDANAGDVVLAAWAAVMARWSGQQRVELGVVLDGREYEELGNLVGAVAKMAPMVVSLKAQATFAELVQQVHAQREEMAGVQEYYAPAKFFKVGFEHVSVGKPIAIAETSFTPLRIEDWTHDCSLKLDVRTRMGGLTIALRHAESVADDLAAELADAFESFLAGALAAPSQTVSSLPMVSAARKQQLVSEWNDTAASYPSGSIHALITAAAMRAPEAAAVRSGSDAVTYGELEARANRLARHLVASGVKRGDLVGLCVARSAQMIVPVLAILKAGAAYVPLSADQPKARTAQQLAGIGALLTEAEFVEHLPEFAGKTIVLDAAEKPWESESDETLDVEVSGDDLAYVIYTSGSTGTPKGVGVRHRNLVNYATHIVRALGLDETPLQYMSVSTLAADLGLTVVYPSLITGGCLHVLPYEVATDAKRMAEYQAEWQIDVLKIVPAHLAALVEVGGHAVLPTKYLITGGEALKPAMVEKLAGASCALINHYGPTETTVGSLMLPLADWKKSTAPTVPIGKPIANTRVYVLDANRELVPVGVAGELYIAGGGVSAGYIGQPEMTAERFVADPFKTGELMYKTGDLVRWLPEGVVEFLGRADDQVKIRGFRVELGEIEAVLAAEAGVRQCVVIARPRHDNPDDKQVVAYVVLDRQQAATADTLKQALKNKLPDYMVPSAIVELQKLPLTPNGKVDRKALPAPEERAAREYKAPATATEEEVARIWEEVLKIQKISTDENFFDLGGHSLLATQVISRIRETFQLEVALRTMFESPVLQNFAGAVDEAKAKGAVSVASAPIKRVARQAYRAGSSGG